MPQGLVMQSGSTRGTETDEQRQEALAKVFEANGREADKPEPAAEEAIEAPKRDAFATDAEFEAAEEAHEQKLEEQEQAEEEKETEREKEKEKLQRKPSRRERAIEKATKDLKDELRKANERLAALEGKKPGTEKTAAVEAPKAPKREDFESDEKFEDAQFDYRYQLRRAKEAAEEAQKSLKSRLEANFTDYKDAAAAFKEEHDDWEKVVNQSIAIPEAVYYAIVDLGKEGPAVTYHLGQHPELLEELAQLTPYRAAAEIGRLAEKLNPGRKPAAAAGEKPKPKPRATIPEPVRPVSTSATSPTLTSREAASKRNFKAFKEAQRRGA